VRIGDGEVVVNGIGVDHRVSLDDLEVRARLDALKAIRVVRHRHLAVTLLVQVQGRTEEGRQLA
jgi:hypothetical protein